MRIMKFILAILLFAALTVVAPAQDGPTVVIRPDSGPVERAVLTILIEGLRPESEYTVAIVYGEEVVFSSEEVSDSEGVISFPVISGEGDLPGTYSAQVLADGEILARGSFELIAEEEGRGPGEVTVRPSAGPIGTVHQLIVGNLEPQAGYTVAITAAESGQVVYRRSRQSDEDGSIQLEVFAEDGEVPGQQAVAVYDADGALVAAGEFTIDRPTERSPSVEVAPQVSGAGRDIDILISGLAAFDSITAQIQSADGLLIDSLLARASDDGAAALRFSAPESMAAGSYRVAVFVDGDFAAEGGLMIEEAAESVAEEAVAEARAAIEPQAGPIGSSHRITVRGLRPREEVGFDVVYGGETVYSSDKTADDGGVAVLELLTGDGDEAGDYIVTAKREAGNEPSVILTATGPESIFDGALSFALTAENPTRTIALPVEAGDRLTLTIDSGGLLDSVMRLSSPDGREIAFDDDSGPGLDAEISGLIIDAAGTYTATIMTYDGGVGEGVLVAAREPAWDLGDGPAIVRINDKGPRDLLVFRAEEGETIALKLEKLSGEVADLFISAAIGGMEVMTYSTMGLPDTLPLVFVAPMGGKVVLDLDKRGYEGDVRLAVSLERA